jgi:hypothetical protein
MSYKAGDWVIVRSLETICEENGRSSGEEFYTRDGIRFNKEKAAYCGRLMLVGQLHTTAGFTGYRLIDPMTDLVVCYKNDVQMLFSDTFLYEAVPASELPVTVGSSVWVRPWNEIIAQANPPARLDDPYCRVNTIYINRSMKKMCLKKYQIIHINYDRYGDTTAAKLRDEDGTIWNFPLSTLYCCSEFVQSIITQPTVSFEELFGKDE